MSQDHNHLNHTTWGVQIPCRVHAQRKECKIEKGHLVPGGVHMLISIPPKYSVGGGDRVSEGEKLDLDCAECGTQAAQFSWSQILGEGLLRFDRREGRGDDSRLYQKSGDGVHF